MLATCICLNGSLLDQLSCTIVYLHNLFTCTFGRINMSVCLSVYSAVEVIACIFRTGINWGGPIAPGRLIPPPYPTCVKRNQNITK